MYPRSVSDEVRGQRTIWLAAAFVYAALSLLTGTASAQTDGPEPPSAPPSDADLERARNLFVEGTQFVEAGRWADALARFEAAYRLSGVPAALFNTATTLRSMGRHRDARDAFDLFVQRHAEADPATAREARERRDEEARRVAVIALSGLEARPAARIFVDDRERAGGGRPVLELEEDPGEHAVRVELEGFSSWRRGLTLEDGERVRLEVSLDPLPGTTELHESPWLWIIVGALVIAGGVTAGVLLYEDAQLEPSPGFDEHVIRL